MSKSFCLGVASLLAIPAGRGLDYSEFLAKWCGPAGFALGAIIYRRVRKF